MPEVTTYRCGEPCWQDLLSADRPAETVFYGALLGWAFDVGPPETGNYTMCLLRGRRVAGLADASPGSRWPVRWNAYLWVDDLDRACAAVTGNGGTVLMGPVDIPDRGRVAALRDPTGALTGLWQAGGHLGSGVRDEPGAPAGPRLCTPEPAVTSGFYTAVVGPAAPVLDAVVHGEPPARWVTGFAVADVDDAARRVAALGGAVGGEPVDGGYGRTVTVRDPLGAEFSLVQQR
jgi:predicted enzyme related to lactoylglutathione lyase